MQDVSGKTAFVTGGASGMGLGIAMACAEAGCALLGGETAEHPGLLKPEEYDVAGAATGVVERAKILGAERVAPGDVVLAMESSGLHSNGYSLVRKIVFDAAGLKVTDPVPELGKTVGEELLTPTRLYVKPVRQVLAHYPVKKKGVVHGLANVTGGGLPDNIGRILPPGCRVRVKAGSWPVPPVFGWLQRLGNVADAEMRRVFNMGVGFVAICAPTAADAIVKHLAGERIDAWKIGEVRDGEVGVEIA